MVGVASVVSMASMASMIVIGGAVVVGGTSITSVVVDGTSVAIIPSSHIKSLFFVPTWSHLQVTFPREQVMVTIPGNNSFVVTGQLSSSTPRRM